MTAVNFCPIKLIVGLGNPGPQYVDTRHNVGFWFVEALANQYQLTLKTEKKFHGMAAKGTLDNHECHLLMPSTFMNLSGQAVAALAQYYKITPPEILVVHDELDLPAGVARFKPHGGHGGHNGLRSIIACLGSNQFFRLRLGIGKPQNAKASVDYVLRKPSKQQQQEIEKAIDESLALIPLLLNGKQEQAMHRLHSETE